MKDDGRLARLFPGEWRVFKTSSPVFDHFDLCVRTSAGADFYTLSENCDSPAGVFQYASSLDESELDGGGPDLTPLPLEEIPSSVLRAAERLAAQEAPRSSFDPSP